MESFTDVPMSMKDQRNIFNLDATAWHPHLDPRTGVVSGISWARLVAADWGGESTADFKDPCECVKRFGKMSLANNLQKGFHPARTVHSAFL
jgi:hypothetical protein